MLIIVQVSGQSRPVVISPIYISTHKDIDKFKLVLVMHAVIMDVLVHLASSPTWCLWGCEISGYASVVTDL